MGKRRTTGRKTKDVSTSGKSSTPAGKSQTMKILLHHALYARIIAHLSLNTLPHLLLKYHESMTTVWNRLMHTFFRGPSQQWTIVFTNPNPNDVGEVIRSWLQATKSWIALCSSILSLILSHSSRWMIFHDMFIYSYTKESAFAKFSPEAEQCCWRCDTFASPEFSQWWWIFSSLPKCWCLRCHLAIYLTHHIQ